MARGPANGSGVPEALSSVLDVALNRWADAIEPATHADGFLFSGNRQQSVPRALFFDARLTPLERNAWQIFRLLLDEGNLTAFPTYERLRPYLSAMPGTAKASHETVARALTQLRLTRWLSLVRRRRDRRTGRLLGNLYVLHDEPLTPFEAIQLDVNYLELISHALTHASKAIRQVGTLVLKEISDDPRLQGKILPTRLQVLSERLSRLDLLSESEISNEASQADAVMDGIEQPTGTPISESEEREIVASADVLRNPKWDRTVRSTYISNKESTVPRARTDMGLRLPARFLTLKHDQQDGALAALRQIDDQLRQAVLDEWSTRCQTTSIRNPAGYLFGIIQKAMRGEFKAWAGQGQLAPAAPDRIK